MTTRDTLLTIVLGLLVNECFEVSPWAARRLIRWAARCRYANPARAHVRAEELTALIDTRPGKLFKLGTALAFVVTAIAIRSGQSTRQRMRTIWDKSPRRDVVDDVVVDVGRAIGIVVGFVTVVGVVTVVSGVDAGVVTYLVLGVLLRRRDTQRSRTGQSPDIE